MSNYGMSKDMYDFIESNLHRLEYDLHKGEVITPKGTRGTLCSSTGYLRVRVNGRTLQVHQILGVIYFGKNCIGKQINHKDGNKINNKKYNLEVVTLKENIKHAMDTGLFNFKSTRGKLTVEEVREIRRDYVPYKDGEGRSSRLAHKYGVSKGTILSVVNRETYKWVD